MNRWQVFKSEHYLDLHMERHHLSEAGHGCSAGVDSQTDGEQWSLVVNRLVMVSDG